MCSHYVQKYPLFAKTRDEIWVIPKILFIDSIIGICLLERFLARSAARGFVRFEIGISGVL